MLTVEQKINMLVLAGYEPYVYTLRTRVSVPRIIKGSSCLFGYALSMPWEFYAEVYLSPNDYTKSTWSDMQLDTCPDKLIYQALEA